MDLAATNDDWETLGREDPFWAVYVAPGRRDGGWDVRAFLETGRVEVERVLARARRLVPAAGRDHALDFGCGVGRLSLPLSTHFAHVTGVDASPTMLARAREIAGDRCTFVLNRAPDLAQFDDASVDLAYSSLVLQHLPRDNALLYVRELVRVTRPTGCVVVQVASRPDWSAKGVAFRFAPPGLTGWAQRHLLHYPAPMLMTALPDRAVRKAVHAAGGTVLAVESDPSYGGHWHYTRYYLAPSRSQPC
jgi:SAM-dependent methyltransferase